MVEDRLFSDHSEHLPEPVDLNMIWKILEYS